VRHVVEAYSMEIFHSILIVSCMVLICPGVMTSSDPGLTRFFLIGLPIIIIKTFDKMWLIYQNILNFEPCCSQGTILKVA
jgi:hypothetical protein